MTTYRTLRDALNQAGEVIRDAVPELADATELVELAERRIEERRKAQTPKFACPGCGCYYSRVIDSREVAGEAVDDAYRRRRICLGCGGRYSTTERLVASSFEPAKKIA